MSVSDLLQPLSGQEETTYYQQLLHQRPCPVTVQHTLDGRSKGVFATQEIAAERVIFREPPFVADQHLANKEDALVCSHCFQFLGSIELQAAWRLRVASEGLPDDTVTQLHTGKLHLPFSDQMALPSPVACRGLCDELYCSQACADADWSDHHRLLCIGEASPNARNPMILHALQAFQHHAQETNDIFMLAAKIIARTLLRAGADLQNQEGQSEGGTEHEQERQQVALKAAWRPVAAGWKAAWWDSIALPEGTQDEHAFRQEVKNLAQESLELLRVALFDRRFPALFSLDVFGNIVGIFELNNLGLVVPSPLLQWLDLAQDSGEESAAGSSAPVAILEALTRLLEDCSACEGTAFYALQSCINHSCSPNASTLKSDRDMDGSAVITARRALAAGEEITISYIEEDLTYSDRQQALRDYGFVCKCERCRSESGG